MFKIKKTVLIFACVSLLICATFMQETFAKYVNNVSGTANMTIARWKILVNDANVTEGSLAANTIVPVFAGNADIAPGVVAPLSTGYFDIVIDASNTDLTFDFTINAEAGIDSDVTDLVTTGYSIDGGAITDFDNYNEDIIGTIAYGTASTTIRVFVLWNDGTGSTMTNANDTTAATGSTPTAAMDVTLSFIQHH